MRTYLLCYWSGGHIFKVGWLDCLYSLPTVSGTFDPTTFVPAIFQYNELILDKSWTCIFLEPNFQERELL